MKKNIILLCLIFFMLSAVGFSAAKAPAKKKSRKKSTAAKKVVPGAKGASPALPPEPLTEDQLKKAIDKLMKQGSVPDFSVSEDPVDPVDHSETDPDHFYYDSMDRHDSSLAEDAPLKLRRFVRYFFLKNDLNGDGILQQNELTDYPGIQSVDLDGDFNIKEPELLFYLARYAKSRTIFSPEPPVAASQQHKVDPAKGIKIHPLSAKVKEAPAPAAAKKLADLTESEFNSMMNKPGAGSDRITTLLNQAAASAEREYTVSPEQLAGIPGWFILKDKNGDGQLSLYEFAVPLTTNSIAFFGRLDLNGDGLITPDELRSALEQRK